MRQDIKQRLARIEAHMPRVVRPEDLEGLQALAEIVAEYDFNPPADLTGDELFKAYCRLLDRAMQDKRNCLDGPRHVLK